MANRFNTPSTQFANSAGVPYSGGTLTFYASGTSNLQNTFSDSALSSANANPVVLDSAGRAGNIFLSNLAYKVVLADSLANQIWTADPVSTSDYSGVAQVTAWSGNPNGSVAGTAGTQGGLPSSVVWDITNNILYVCTTTGNAAAAVWTGVNASSATPAIPMPQGYLTPTSATPIILSDSIGATAVLYTPYAGNLVPIYNGSSFAANTFTEQTLTLAAQHAVNSVYDIFVFNNSGVLTLVTGPAWTSLTARGTGAGTTQLTKLSGIWVNTVQITGRNGATTYTIAANLATYLGSIYIDNTAGQVTCHRAYGQNRKWGIWNAYNRVPIYLKGGDGTASWSYGTNTLRASNNVPSGAFSATAFNVGSGTTCNGMSILTGLAEELVDAQFSQIGTSGVSGSSNQGFIAIGYNSVTAQSGTAGESGHGADAITTFGSMVAKFMAPPALGVNIVAPLEKSLQGNAFTFNGAETNMTLVAYYRG